jgi:hypothetical protein
MLIEVDWIAHSVAAEITVAIFAMVTAHGLHARHREALEQGTYFSLEGCRPS